MRMLVSCLVLLILLTPGCALIDSLVSMTPAQKAKWMMTMYNAEYALYQTQAAMPDLSDKQKQILNWKKRILIAVHPLILTYVGSVETDEPPPVSLELRIMRLLNDLLMEVNSG